MTASLCRVYAMGLFPYVPLRDGGTLRGDTRAAWNFTMNDLTAVGIFFCCVIGTLGLVRVCEWLKPRDRARDDSGPGALKEGARQ